VWSRLARDDATAESAGVGLLGPPFVERALRAHIGTPGDAEMTTPIEDTEFGRDLIESVGEVRDHLAGKIALTTSGAKAKTPTDQPPIYDLDRLLDQMTPGSLHDDEDFGPPVGREVW